MIVATILSLVTVLLCVSVHYEVLTRMSCFIPLGGRVARPAFLLLMASVFVAHFVEIWIYAGALALLEGIWGVGHIAGDFNQLFFDYVYFSAVTYTSLGLGDVWPHGPVRLLTGIEALNGLLLVGWSIWFTYPIVRRGCQIVRKDNQ